MCHTRKLLLSKRMITAPPKHSGVARKLRLVPALQFDLLPLCRAVQVSGLSADSADVALKFEMLGMSEVFPMWHCQTGNSVY